MQTRRNTPPRRFTGSTKKKSYGIGGAVMTLGKNLLQGKKFGKGMFGGVLKAGVTPGSGLGAGLGLAGALAGKSKNPFLQKVSKGLGVAGNVAGMFTGGGGGGVLQGLAGKFAGGGGGGVLQGLAGKFLAKDGMKVYASGGSIPRMKVLKSYHDGGGIPHQHGKNGDIKYETDDNDRVEGTGIYVTENNWKGPEDTGGVVPSKDQKVMGGKLKDDWMSYMKAMKIKPGNVEDLFQLHQDGEINLNEIPEFQNIIELATAGWSDEAKERYTEAVVKNQMGGAPGQVFGTPFRGLNLDEASFMKETKNRDFNEPIKVRNAGLVDGRLKGRKSNTVGQLPSMNFTYTEGMKKKFNPDLARLTARPPEEIINDRDKELMVGPPPGEFHGYGEDPIDEFHGYGEDDPEPDPVGGLGEYDLGLGDVNPSDYTGSTAEQRATGPWSGETRDPRMQGIKLLKEGETQEDGGSVYAHGGRIPNRMLRQMLKKDTYRLRRRR
tara:strand:- start:21 stop:1496 length:1476 start_codon:yes stop_codon:yes gene_type:complete